MLTQSDSFDLPASIESLSPEQVANRASLHLQIFNVGEGVLHVLAVKRPRDLGSVSPPGRASRRVEQVERYRRLICEWL